MYVWISSSVLPEWSPLGDHSSTGRALARVFFLAGRLEALHAGRSTHACRVGAMGYRAEDGIGADSQIQEHAHPDWRVDDEQITDVALRPGCAMRSRRRIYELAAL